jgi:hypothetical protein
MSLLHGVNKSLFNPIEDQDPNQQDNEHKDKSVCQARPGSSASAKESGSKGFNDG